MRVALWVWGVASVLWMAVVGYVCLQSWPYLSLDLAQGDAETRSAFDAAVSVHVVWHFVAAVAVPIIVFAFLPLLVRRRG